MAIKALQARRRNYLMAKEAQNGQLVPAESAHAIATENPSNDDFSRQRLATVRAQLNRIDAMIELEVDPQKIDRLASASAKLSEIERVLSNRPLPGSFRPSAPKRPSMFDEVPLPPRQASDPEDAKCEQE